MQDSLRLWTVVREVQFSIENNLGVNSVVFSLAMSKKMQFTLCCKIE